MIRPRITRRTRSLTTRTTGTRPAGGSIPLVLALAVLASLAGEDARAQGDVLFPGSTVQGDILRGEGVAYNGAALLYLNAARALSIDADTRMRFNQYVYNSLQEYN